MMVKAIFGLPAMINWLKQMEQGCKQYLPFRKELYAQVHTILKDKGGNIWVNFNNGLKKFTYNTGKGIWNERTYSLKEINTKTDITCLYEDSFGHIWAGTLGKGIILLILQLVTAEI